MSFHWFRAAPRALVARRLWSVPVFVALGALAPAIGCGPVLSAPGFESAGPDASLDAGSSSGVADAASSCHASAVLTYMQGNYQPAAAPSGACLGADGGGTWDDFYVSCLGPDQSQDHCTAYEQVPANAACAACILTPYTASRLGPILNFGQFVGENIAGCIEIAVPGDPSCPKAVQALTGCELAACQANCPVDDPASLATRQQCAADADRAGCLSFFQMASACQASEADAGLLGPCENTGFKDFYDNVVPLFCGQTELDAGVSIDAGLSNDASPGLLTDGGSPATPSDAGAD